MGKYSDYKKLTSAYCYYCDYLSCRKNHNKKCKWYKKAAKESRKNETRIFKSF